MNVSSSNSAGSSAGSSLPGSSGSPVQGLPKVLVVESNESLATEIGVDLHEAGYALSKAHSVATAMALVHTEMPALVVVAKRLGDSSGLDLCRRLRAEQNRVPILLMMPHDALADRVDCLESGADDYFLAPYRSDEFIKLVNAYLKPSAASGEQLRFADLMLDLAQRQVIRNNRIIELTMKEFELLKYLMEHPREVLTRKQILESVWGYDFIGESNVIEVYIRYLRLKIDGENEKRLIQTVRSVGYVLRES
jgi:two-component system, OmpR family, response regulator NblR